MAYGKTGKVLLSLLLLGMVSGCSKENPEKEEARYQAAVLAMKQEIVSQAPSGLARSEVLRGFSGGLAPPT